MCAHPSQKQSVGSCLSLSLRPESRAHASPAMRAADPVLPRLTRTGGWQSAAALDGTVIGNSTLSGRAFSVWSWLRATSEAIGQTVVGGRQYRVCLVSAAGKTTGSSLTTVSPAVAHTRTHARTHTHTHPPHRRATGACRGADLGNAGQSPSTLCMRRVGLRFVETGVHGLTSLTVGHGAAG